MDILLFMLSGLGLVASLVMLVVSIIKKKPKKKALISLGVFFLVFAVSLGMGPDTVDDTAADEVEELADEPEPVKAEKASEPVKEEPKVEKVEESSKGTLAQQNAVKQAESYLSLMGFSKSGLVEQLEFEGYETADAQYAVDNIKVDWMEQAVIKGKDYLDTMSFSRSGLIEQLQFEGFTNEQATYAVDQIGL